MVPFCSAAVGNFHSALDTLLTSTPIRELPEFRICNYEHSRPRRIRDPRGHARVATLNTPARSAARDLRVLISSS